MQNYKSKQEKNAGRAEAKGTLLANKASIINVDQTPPIDAENRQAQMKIQMQN